ncbi:MAG: mechanosensitive ion channel [Candidatus Caldarchaeum sp.]|uniref:Mechanosensitive ion channel n=1 Tax=Caldiarchaeum subterraneum TaxID=311458 RepID=A0A7J3VTK0_CALS0
MVSCDDESDQPEAMTAILSSEHVGGKSNRGPGLSFFMIIDQLLATAAASAVFALAAVVSRFLLRRRFREEHGKVLYLVLLLLSAVYVGYVAYLWRFFEFVVGVLATAGALGLLLALSLVPWVTDIFSGISVVLDPRINIGSEVEIDGRRGKIIDITLTRTVVSGDECIILVPNRKFRDSVVVVYSTKPREKYFKD